MTVPSYFIFVRHINRELLELPTRFLTPTVYVQDVYIFPRLAVLPGHEHKGCKYSPADLKSQLTDTLPVIPFSNVLNSGRNQDLCLHATVHSVHPSHVVLDRSFPEKGILTPELHFDYLIYALGSRLPAPLDLWGSHPGSGSVSHEVPTVLQPYTGTKREGMAWLRAHQDVIKSSGSVLVVGGGALGIRQSFARRIFNLS